MCKLRCAHSVARYYCHFVSQTIISVLKREIQEKSGVLRDISVLNVNLLDIRFNVSVFVHKLRIYLRI